ncbi:MAG: phosphoglycerate kinase, partial [Mesorhizobium sp.]
RTMQAELDALEKGLGNPVRPVVAIVGGAKVSSKIDLLMNLVKKVDALVIGGGMANTFLAARGTDVGKSLCDIGEVVGDTVAALNHAGVADDFTYVSTAGGAFLEWMEGKPLPGVDVLKR